MKRYKIIGFCVFILLISQSELKGEKKGIIGSFYFSTSQVNVTQFDITQEQLYHGGRLNRRKGSLTGNQHL